MQVGPGMTIGGCPVVREAGERGVIPKAEVEVMAASYSCLSFVRRWIAYVNACATSDLFVIEGEKPFPRRQRHSML